MNAGGARRRRRGLAALLTVAAMLALAACSPSVSIHSTSSSAPPATTSGVTTSTTGTGTTTPIHTDGLVWIVSRAALADVAAIDPTALKVLEAGRIYELLSARQHPVAGVDAVITQDFTSFAALSAAVQDGLLVPGAQAVLYDPEHWSLTPLSEQEDVATYIGDAVTLAHQHGLQIIVTPGTDLVTVVSPGAGAGDVARFLSSGIEQAAAAADVVDIQAQSREHDPGTYASYVVQAAAVIHAKRAAAIVVAGLSTNPPSGAVTATQLAAAIDAVKADVQGFWLNIPTKGNACPSCSSNPDPQAGAGALVEVWG